MMQVIEKHMTSEQFIYWIQGFSEGRTKPPTDKEWKMIQDHLGTVFTKVTQDYTTTTTDTLTPLLVPYKPDFPGQATFIC